MAKNVRLPNRAGSQVSYYKILGVNPQAKPEAIRHAYLQLMSQAYGPDEIDDTVDDALQEIRDRIEGEIAAIQSELSLLIPGGDREQERLDLEARKQDLEQQLAQELETEEAHIRAYGQSIKKAYKILSNEDSRAEYDKDLKASTANKDTYASQLFTNMGCGIKWL